MKLFLIDPPDIRNPTTALETRVRTQDPSTIS